MNSTLFAMTCVDFDVKKTFDETLNPTTVAFAAIENR